jgi:hypothetical protein
VAIPIPGARHVPLIAPVTPAILAADARRLLAGGRAAELRATRRASAGVVPARARGLGWRVVVRGRAAA